MNGGTGAPSGPPAPARLACAVCGTALQGRFLRSWWGDAFCPHHPTCDSCQRPLAVDPPPPGTDLRCSRCRYHAVTMRDEAVRALLRVGAWMEGLGLALVLTDVPLRFLDADQPSRVPNPARTLTQEVRRIDRRGRRSVERSITGVELVRGLTTVHASSLLAHELTHAWLFLSHVDIGDLRVEEGAAELVRSFWLRAQPDAEAAYWLEAMERNADPLYGDGYRAVRDRYRGEPLAAFLRGLALRGGPAG